MRRVLGGSLLLAAAAGCAQPGSPPGGEVDRSPPRVVAVTPAPLDTLTDLRTDVVIRFNERISERLEGVQDWEDAVVVSPETSPVRVDAGRRQLEISLVRGWQPDQVYRITVRPVFRDLFNNPRVEPIELVFSTGAPIPDAALAGFVEDRLTGNPAPLARVEAVRRLDQTTYVALTDTAGFFAMRYMPAGAYDVRAWLDQDRNREMAFFEAQDSADVVFGVRDTAVVELALLRPDTTPARLAQAVPIDSTKVRLVFDDYFAPGPVDGEAWLYTLPDSVRVGEGTLVHGTRLDSIQAAEAEAAAALEEARDTAVADTTGPTERREREREQEPEQEQEQEEGERPAPVARQAAAERASRAPLPSQELILLAPIVLQPDSAYYVLVTGVTNINGVPGGGGTAAFLVPPPPPPSDTVPTDTVPSDTVPSDTVPSDTVPPDTVPSDTVPPDTVPR